MFLNSSPRSALEEDPRQRSRGAETLPDGKMVHTYVEDEIDVT